MTAGKKSKPMDIFSADPASLDTDLLIVPVFDGETADERFSAAAGGELTRARTSGEFSGKLYETFFAPVSDRAWKARRIAMLGLGPSTDFTVDRARRAATAAGLQAKQKKIARVALLATGPLVRVEMVQAVVEGLTLCDYDGATYKTAGYQPFELVAFAIVTSEVSSTLQSAVERGRVLGECCNTARRLANEPANRLRPSAFAEQAASIAREAGLEVDVLDEPALRKFGMGMLLGVGQGSHERPRMVTMRYKSGAAAGSPVLGLVGKGITFDTGGISIKPAEGMERMKDDMAGGAAVIGAMKAIARLRGPIDVVGIVPIAENMPGGDAFRPGDVLTSASGKTVEILNTDAEGRLILGDALWYAQQMGATHLVDIATLTGAITVALGKLTSGLFATPAPWLEYVRAVAEQAGDRAWPMPLFEEYKDLLKSEIADIVNTGGRYGGAITAALFLKEFTGGKPWAHIDVAGTAWIEDARPYIPKGASGIGVRTLAALALDASNWPKL